MKTMWPMKKYPYICFILEIRGGASKVIIRKGRFLYQGKDKITKFQIKNYPIQPDEVPFECIKPGEKGNKEYVEFESTSEKEIHPFIFVNNENVPRINPRRMNQLAHENKLLNSRYRKASSWQWILPIIPVAVVVILSLIWFTTTLDKATQQLEMISGSSHEMAISNYNSAIANQNLAIALKGIYPDKNIVFVNETFLWPPRNPGG